MSDFVSRNIWIVPWSYEENLEGVTQAAVSLVEMLAPNDQNAQVEILITVQHLYWTTDIAVSEIRDAYAPGMLISAVVTIAGAGKLNVVCRRCGGALYVTSRTAFKDSYKRVGYYRGEYSLLDICPACRGPVRADAVRRGIIIDAGEDELRENREPSTAAMSYQDYLQTTDWKIRREGALKRAKFSCQVCSGKGELHVHHRTYLRRGNEVEGDLIVLCATCHKLFHDNGKLAEGGRADV